MPPTPLPRGHPLRRVLDTLADQFGIDTEAVIRRRLIAIIAEAGLTVTATAAKIDMAHGLLARKLAGPGTAAANRRPLDDETIDKILVAVGRGYDRLLTIEHELADVEVLHWISDTAQERRVDGASRYVAAKTALPIEDAAAQWPDAYARIARLTALGFVSIIDDGAPCVSLTPTGRTCAAR